MINIEGCDGKGVRLTMTFRSLSSISELTRNSLSPRGFTRLLLLLTFPPSNIAFLAPPKTEEKNN